MSTKRSMIWLPILKSVLLILMAIFVFPIGNSTAQADTSTSVVCGQNNQRACDQRDCEVRAGWFIIVYPYTYCPNACETGLTNVSGRCQVPSGACDISCKMKKISAYLGQPSGIDPTNTMYCFGSAWDPYHGLKVSRADIGVSDSDKSIYIDVGGEGLYQEEGSQWGSDQAINLNCSLNRTTMGDTKKSINNLVFGFGQNMPFADRFADKIVISNAPVFPSELERVIRPGGTLEFYTTDDSNSKVNQIQVDLCVSALTDFKNGQSHIVMKVPDNFDYQHTNASTCTFTKDDL